MPGEDVGLKEHMLKAAAEANVEAPHKSSAAPDMPVEDGVADKAEGEVEGEKIEVKAPAAIDAIAKEWGHVSKEDFEANPANAGKAWVDAETFVRNMKPIADSHRHRDRESQKQLDELTKVTKKLLEKQEASEKRIAEADKRAKEQLLNDLNAQLDAATDEGNKDGVRDIAKKIAMIQGEINASVPKPDDKTTQDAQGEDAGVVPASKSPTVARWMGRNEKSVDNPNGWYGDTDNPVNAALTLYADKRSVELGADEAGNPRTWQEIFSVLDLELVRKREALQARITPPKQTPGASPAGGGTPASQGGGGVADLTPEERRVGQAFIDRGLYKNLTEYAKALRSA